jgi:hypothetical protein
VDFNTKLRDVLYRSSRQDNLAINEQIELFSGGFKLGTGWKIKDTFLLDVSGFDFLMYTWTYLILALDETEITWANHLI